MLLVSETKKWSDEIKSGRCSDPDYNHDSGPCDEIKFYLSDVDFNNIEDESERHFFETLPTSFKLPSETVDKLNDAGGRLLRNSAEFQDLLTDLK
jgi:NTE family protein